MPPPPLSRIDHFVLTVASVAHTAAFYADALGMNFEQFCPADGSIRTALTFGAHKINLHEVGREFDPKAAAPTPGSGDFCLISDAPTEDWLVHLRAQGIAIADGPVSRTGATGPLVSIYLRDPDGNLVEIARPA
jgi:catechol 2,3-dioxygenase-like lactoylglutathione lyase family enzyme